MSIDTQKNVNILPALKEFYFYKMTKKYIPDEKEKYMCAKHKAYFKRRLIEWRNEVIKSNTNLGSRFLDSSLASLMLNIFLLGKILSLIIFFNIIF